MFTWKMEFGQKIVATTNYVCNKCYLNVSCFIPLFLFYLLCCFLCSLWLVKHILLFNSVFKGGRNHILIILLCRKKLNSLFWNLHVLYGQNSPLDFSSLFFLVSIVLSRRYNSYTIKLIFQRTQFSEF